MAIEIVPIVDYRALYLAQEGKCFYCDQEMYPGTWTPTRQKGWSRDHVRPRSAGNTLLNNVVLSCVECNGRKAAAPPGDEVTERFQTLMGKYNALATDTTKVVNGRT